MLVARHFQINTHEEDKEDSEMLEQGFGTGVHATDSLYGSCRDFDNKDKQWKIHTKID